ncbi:Hsp20/alpha crystallin family protein [Brevibacillus sp. B_LB10_24]|uniref:Hsp20/alpha crystallin family protein n=1 Tax=Brevibacillus sp. B_LB10_24 TaxID=3380645 RepID=UPI0038B95EF5
MSELFPGLFREFERRFWHDPLRLQPLFAEWHQVGVKDQGDAVQIIAKVPGHKPDQFKWQARVVGQSLSLKGELQEEQTVRRDGGEFYSKRKTQRLEQTVLLPANVKDRPSSVRHEGERLILVYRKQQRPVHGSWHAIYI